MVLVGFDSKGPRQTRRRHQGLYSNLEWLLVVLLTIFLGPRQDWLSWWCDSGSR